MADDKPELDNIQFEDTAEFVMAHDDIAAALNAINAVDGMDEAIQTDLDKQRIKRIRRMSLRIIDSALKEIYDARFGEE